MPAISATKPNSPWRGAVAGIVLALLVTYAPARAENGFWEPAGIRRSDTPLAEVLAKARGYSGTPGVDYGARTERYAVSAQGFSFEAESTVRGDDFSVRASLAGERYSAGRFGGYHYRQTPRGLVRLVESDVQGDDLDRWPTAILPLSERCALAGETRTPNPAWVLIYRREHDVPHWFFVDRQSGAIVREITLRSLAPQSATRKKPSEGCTATPRPAS